MPFSTYSPLFSQYFLVLLAAIIIMMGNRMSGIYALIALTVKSIDWLNIALGRLISWLTLLMVVLTFAIVVLRYGFNIGWIAMQESVLYFHGLVFMLGAAYTLKVDGHVRVDIFYQKFTKKTKALVDLFGALFLLLPVCIFLFYISFNYVEASWQIFEKSSEAGGLPFVYIAKSYLLLLAVTLGLQGVAEVGRNTLILTGHVQALTSSKTDSAAGVK